jgi:hypothetical protein
MAIEFACPACGKQIRAKDEFVGKEGKCGKCGTQVVVPNKAEVFEEVFPEVRDEPEVKDARPSESNNGQNTRWDKGSRSGQHRRNRNVPLGFQTPTFTGMKLYADGNFSFFNKIFDQQATLNDLLVEGSGSRYQVDKRPGEGQTLTVSGKNARCSGKFVFDDGEWQLEDFSAADELGIRMADGSRALTPYARLLLNLCCGFVAALFLWIFFAAITGSVSARTGAVMVEGFVSMLFVLLVSYFFLFIGGLPDRRSGSPRPVNLDDSLPWYMLSPIGIMGRMKRKLRSRDDDWIGGDGYESGSYDRRQYQQKQRTAGGAFKDPFDS